MTTENRMNAWRQAQTKSGKKVITASIPIEAHETLQKIRQDTKESFGDILGRFLMGMQEQSPDQNAVIIILPSKIYDRLDAEYDLAEHFQQFALKEAESLFNADGGDF